MDAHVLRVHNILYQSKVNGPGVRSVIWVQGCDKRCEGCWNPETWDILSGYTTTLGQILKDMPINSVEGLTFSGGEPFLQPLACAELATIVKQQGKSIMCYTGYEYTDLIESNNERINTFLSCIDILVDGPYKKDIPPVHPWAGSGNQRVLFLKEGRIVKEESYKGKAIAVEHEIIISEDGTITCTGM